MHFGVSVISPVTVLTIIRRVTERRRREISMKRFIAAGFMVLVLTCTTFGADEVFLPKMKVSPHGEDADCSICHVAPEKDLRSWFTFPWTKKKFKLDYNSLCRQCHGVDFGHGVGEKPTLNRDGLPLDANETIACAITCHNMHVSSEDPVQNRYHLRISRDKLCFSCHNK